VWVSFAAERRRLLTGLAAILFVVAASPFPGTPPERTPRRHSRVLGGPASHAGGVAIVAFGRGEANPVAPNSKDGKDNPQDGP
jgi:hypothetical protein